MPREMGADSDSWGGVAGLAGLVGNEVIRFLGQEEIVLGVVVYLASSTASSGRL